MDKPKWWPKNPYFESAMDTIKNDTDYAKAIPDSVLRTTTAWYLSNRAWELASDAIFKAMEDQDELLPGGVLSYDGESCAKCSNSMPDSHP